MGRLTSDERRRVFLTRQTAAREALARLDASAPPAVAAATPVSRFRRLAAIATIAMMLSGGWLALQSVAFHRPASLAEALWPRW